MESGTYAWIVVSLFFVFFTIIQIRNCIKNVKCRGNSYEDMYPNFMSQAQMSQNGAPIFTIAGTQVRAAPAGVPNSPAYTNTGYQVTETHVKTDLNDGLPTYEEVIAATTPHQSPEVTTPNTTSPTNENPPAAASVVTTTTTTAAS